MYYFSQEEGTQKKEHRRATISPHTGYYEIACLLATRPQTGYFKNLHNYDFFPQNMLIVSLLYRIKGEPTF